MKPDHLGQELERPVEIIVAVGAARLGSNKIEQRTIIIFVRGFQGVYVPPPRFTGFIQVSTPPSESRLMEILF